MSILSNNTIDDSPENLETRLLYQVESLLHSLGDHVDASLASSAGDDSASALELCSWMLTKVGRTSQDLRQRLAAAENRNLEQELQLRARASESTTDPLTKVANRRAFDAELSTRCATAENAHCPVSLMMLDIDHFKAVNDNNGHHVGDAVLRGVAAAIVRRLPVGAVLARYGGEEFAVLFSSLTIDQAVEAAEDVRRYVAKTIFTFQDRPLHVTVSCGVAQWRLGETTFDIVQRADGAMYASKQAGRNRTSWHDAELVHEFRATEDFVNPDGASRVASEATESCVRVELDTIDQASVLNSPLSATPPTNHYRSVRRINCCDATMLFWCIRQRIEEFKRGGAPFCVLAIELDDKLSRIAEYGPSATQFFLRTQLLHLDSTLNESDIVGRIGQSRVLAILPQTSIDRIVPLCNRLKISMQRFVFPTLTAMLDYSISVGVAEVALDADPAALVRRAETALEFAQGCGRGQFVASLSGRLMDLMQGEPIVLNPSRLDECLSYADR